jgi:hypothetical protein
MLGKRVVGGLAGGVLVAAVVGGSGAWAAVTSNPPPSVTYTGCLGGASGSIYNVKQSSSPLAACTAGDKQIKLSAGDITGVTAGAGLTGGAVKGAATLVVDPSWLAANATTGVTAETGLTGGAASGPATLAVDPAFRLPQGCSSGTAAVSNGSSWACGTALSKQFSFSSITTGHTVAASLGSIQLQLTCNASTANVNAYADSSVGGSINMSYTNLSDSSSHDSGFRLSTLQTGVVATSSGGTGEYVWDDDNGNVITGNVTWYNPGSGANCQFNGDLIQAAS